MAIYAQPAEPVQVGGYRCWSDAYAQADEGFVFASLLGAATVVEAVWSYLVAASGVGLTNDVFLSRALEMQSTRDKDKTLKVHYRKTAIRLPESEAAHLLVVSELATLSGVSRELPAYLIADNPAGDLDRFWAFWNKLVPLPALADWAGFLWKVGLRHELIKPVAEVHGCYAWEIAPDTGEWGKLLTGGIEDGVLHV